MRPAHRKLALTGVVLVLSLVGIYVVHLRSSGRWHARSTAAEQRAPGQPPPVTRELVEREAARTERDFRLFFDAVSVYRHAKGRLPSRIGDVVSDVAARPTRYGQAARGFVEDQLTKLAVVPATV